MRVIWRCKQCPEWGEGDRGAERHTNETSHSTLTFTMEEEDE